jgi:murein DD-endopeptidase MepM/ murein hydrolase activator NlpD
MRLQKIWIVTLLLTLAACVRPAPDSPPWNASGADSTPGLPPASVTGSTATASFRLLPTRIPGSPILTPTPDVPRFLPTPRSGPETYVVQAGDTLGAIGLRYGVSVEALMQANGLYDPNALDVGQTLKIPVPTPQATGPSFKILPDSELVYGPMSLTLDLEAFIRSKAGYLASYQQDVDGEVLNAAQIVRLVAQNYSVNPRLLLAVLEYHSGWVTNPNPNPATLDTPLGFNDNWHIGLYRQLTWAANALNQGYYRWRVGAVSDWVLADGSVVPVAPSINAGTAGVQNLFAQLDDYPTWLQDVSQNGLSATYSQLFGYPFDLAIEPIVPGNLIQPPMQLPFASGEIWAFTGGPHGGWDEGSVWAALDFAPPGEAQGCVPSDAWVTAVADGLILRAENGAVVQDLGGDGYEQTGWTVLYMHIESRDRVRSGTSLHAGERIGHPSCEGGLANGTHLHLARRFNGEWIPADGSVPFVLDGWVSSGTGVEYDGYLTRNGVIVEAFDGNNPINQIQR